MGLETIHNKEFMHRDFHSGNILFDPKEAIYTSRPLSALISKCSSIYSFSTISFDSNYISELENNKDIESLSGPGKPIMEPKCVD
ncbi:unnamed protein product [Rhizophagus irregularis]|uniref:Protein kinase domain-containing protein n=1 Tax=Rhizophagus irregularis TaxID=588596 RepID=A0A915Z5J6_9GLOM|nr:unnamed protein product [Rhizophagus irregularis]